jgi:hypothetical protein
MNKNKSNLLNAFGPSSRQKFNVMVASSSKNSEVNAFHHKISAW